MLFDLSHLPLSSAVVASGVLWAGISALALGPMVADRTIQNTGWPKICEARLQAAHSSTPPSVNTAPQIGCGDIEAAFGSAHGFCQSDAGQAIDGVMGLLTALSPEAQAQRAADNFAAREAQRAISEAPNRCACAARQVGSDRLGWGLYAGTMRLVGRPQDLNAELMGALQNPLCSSMPGGLS